MSQVLVCINLGEERLRAKLWRRFLRASPLGYRQVFTLLLALLFLLSLQAHVGRLPEQQEGQFDSDPIVSKEVEPVTSRSARHLTSSMHHSGAFLGRGGSSKEAGNPDQISPRVIPSLRLQTLETKQKEKAMESRTLRFLTCNGFANQRLALAYGIILAKATNRVPVLPDFLLNGIQRTDAWIVDVNRNSSLPMSNMYDTKAFKAGMLMRANMEVLSPEEAPPVSNYARVSLERVANAIPLTEASTSQHVFVGCTLLKLTKETIKEHEGLFWAVMDSLTPVPRLQGVVKSAVQRLKVIGREMAEEGGPETPVKKNEGTGKPFDGPGFGVLAVTALHVGEVQTSTVLWPAYKVELSSPFRTGTLALRI